MPFIYREYGEIVEITEVEKESSKIRIYRPLRVRTVYKTRRPDNIRSSQKLCLRRVSAGLRAFGKPLFVTLTFDGDASDAAFANDAIRDFKVRLRVKFAHAESVFVPELSPKGRIHFHGLLFNVPLSLGDTKVNRRIVAYGAERKKRILRKLWREGNVDALKTDGAIRLAYYLSKYITKGAKQTIFNAMRIVLVSRGIPKEIVERGEVAENYARKYADKNPFREWESSEPFHKKIKKKFYQREL